MTKEETRHDWKTPVGVATAMMLVGTIAWSTFQAPGEQEQPESLTVKSDQIERNEEVILLTLARQAAEQGYYETALQHIDQVTDIQPDSIPANLLKAELLFRLYRADEMRPALENILRQDSEHFEAHANMAFALRFSGELDEAEKHVDWCLLRRPDFLPILRIRAQIFRDGGDSNRALTEIQSVLKSHPDDIESRILEAEILMYQRDFKAAYQSLKPISTVAPRNHRVAALMSQVCQLLGKKTEATEFRAILNDQKPESTNQ